MRKYKHSEKVAYRFFDDECVLYTAHNNTFHQMNKVGARIWNDCKRWKSVKEITQSICAAYDVEEKKARDETIHFLNEMKRQELIMVKENDSTR